jgi:hypothetical protein|tara:strand:- start:1065 stop:1241 length:177 start_codon:yes stop_codon:yes gene_type:complete
MKDKHAALKKHIIAAYGEEGALDALITLYQLKEFELNTVLLKYGHTPSLSILEDSNES